MFIYSSNVSQIKILQNLSKSSNDEVPTRYEKLIQSWKSFYGEILSGQMVISPSPYELDQEEMIRKYIDDQWQ